MVNGEICSDPDVVLETWSDHFKTLSNSHSDQFPSMDKIQQEYDLLYGRSFENDDSEMLVDTPFTLEETEGVIKNLKSGKASGLDHLQAEHLKFGGNSLVLWVQQVCNAAVELETIPDVLKLGVVNPVYKGNGRDPLDTNSYRGITLSSVLSKILELLLLGRFRTILFAPEFPHQNQTGFVKKTSCTDAIFSSHEVLSRLARGGDRAYICFFDLQKAFDTVQYPLLLKRAFDCGINGKAWRLLNSWYTKPKCKIQVNKKLSSSITLERGVLQGSVLSPTLFLMIMDPLLKELERRSVGPCIGGLYCGAFAHADDIRTISTSRDTLHEQISIVESFTVTNALVLNAQKCEVVVVSPTKPADVSVCTVAGHQLVPSTSAKCLGHWWSWDLSSVKAINEAIGKARKCFFAYGAAGAFEGQLNPLSGRAIFEACVEPVLLYNCENWFLTKPLLEKLESFQAEIGRRILTLPRFHSSRAVRLALGWPSITTRVFAKKLAFLARVLENSDSIGHHFYDCLLESSDEGSMQLLDGCSFLEELLGVEGCLQRIKEGSSSSREIKKELIDLDFSSLLEESKTHSSTSVAAEIAESTSWLKIWDLALDYGPRGTSAIQALFSTMTRTMCGSAPCGFCEESVTTTYLDHFLLCHLPTNCPGMSKEDILGELKKANPDINYIIRLFSPNHMSTLRSKQ